MDVAPEHHLIDFGRHHDIALHRHAKRQAECRADKGKQQRFSIDIGIHLVWSKAKHLKRRNLAHAFGDIDIREVIEHDKRKQRGGNHEHDDDRIDAFQHRPIAFDRLVVVGDGFHPIGGQQIVAEGLAQRIAFADIREQRGIRRSLAHHRFVKAWRHEHVLRNIVLHNARNAHKAPIACGISYCVFVEKLDAIAHRNAQPRSKLLADKHP